MVCDEIRERFIELVYDESGTSAPAEMREHLRTCPACRREFEELEQTRAYLQRWKDEPPLQGVRVPSAIPNRSRVWRYLRYGAVAAMVVMSVLALANMQIIWNKDGISLSTHLFARHGAEQDYYTKAEIRNLMKQALDDSELNMSETNYLMMQKMLDAVEQDRWMDLRLIRSQAVHKYVQNHN
jgi:hypothetical protein